MIELTIPQLKTLIKSTEYYLKNKQQLTNTTNEEINDIKMLIWQLRDELERETKIESIYGFSHKSWQKLEPTFTRRKRPYYRR